MDSSESQCVNGIYHHQITTQPGKRWHNYGESPFLPGRLTNSMAILNSYAKLSDGNSNEEHCDQRVYTGLWLGLQWKTPFRQGVPRTGWWKRMEHPENKNSVLHIYIYIYIDIYTHTYSVYITIMIITIIDITIYMPNSDNQTIVYIYISIYRCCWSHTLCWSFPAQLGISCASHPPVVFFSTSQRYCTHLETKPYRATPRDQWHKLVRTWSEHRNPKFGQKV